MAELGISVLPEARRSGIGRALMQRAAVYARNRSVAKLHVYCLADNVAMMRLARRAGMEVVVESGDAEAHIALPAPTPSSIATEYIADNMALLDYAVRSSVETWRRVGVAFAQSSTW